MTLRRRYFIAAGAGLTLAAAFPAVGIWPLGFVALAALWWVLEDASRKGAFGLGMTMGMAFWLPHVWWAFTSVGAAPWIALSLLQSLAVALFAVCWAWVIRSEVLRGQVFLEPVVFAGLWVAFEQLRSLVPFGGFPWGRLAFAFVDSPLAPLAWLGGAAFVSFVVALVAGLLALAFEAARVRRVTIPIYALGGAVLIVVSGLLIPLDARAENGTLTVGVVQGNVPDEGLDAFQQARLVTENHHAETLRLAGSAAFDLVVWPENAADIDPRIDTYTANVINDAARAVESPILLGTVDFTPEEGRLNTALLWDDSGTVLDTYSKQHPAPFAEYIPMRDFARIFSDAVDRVLVDMIPGDGPGVVFLPNERLGRDVIVGDVICFEVAYDPLVRDSVSAGAEFLVVQTNNASFGETAESVQQLAMTRLRAIETGRLAIQSSTVGVSGAVAPDGRVLTTTELFTAGSFTVDVPLRVSITPAVAAGRILDWLFLLAPVFGFGTVWVMSFRERWDWD